MLLALDTSTHTVGVALYDRTRVLSESVWISPDYHTVELAPKVAETLSKSGMTAVELGAVAVAIGPGSFTGLRIGLALAKGLALAHHLALLGIPTLDILAAAQASSWADLIPGRMVSRSGTDTRIADCRISYFRISVQSSRCWMLQSSNMQS